jgi:hypothetical protein
MMGPTLTTEELPAWCLSRGLRIADGEQLHAVFAERDELRAALEACANSLEEEIRDTYGVSTDDKLAEMHEVSVRRFHRDMAPVREARSALSRSSK